MTSHVAIAAALVFDMMHKLSFTSGMANSYCHKIPVIGSWGYGQRIDITSHIADFVVECKNSSKDQSAHYPYIQYERNHMKVDHVLKQINSYQCESIE